MTTTDSPAIRFTDYMGGYEEMHAVNLIGPYPSVQARDADLERLRGLPLGKVEFHGGQTYDPASMADARGDDVTVVAAPRVARAGTQREFHAAFYGYEVTA